MKKIALLFLSALFAYEISPLRATSDPRIKSVKFVQDVPIKFVAYYGIQTMISFNEEEKIEKIILSDSKAWDTQIIYSNKLILKPVEQNPATNMIVITNQRTYHFVLYAIKTASLNDPNITFELKVDTSNNSNNTLNAVPILNEKNKKEFNLNYKFSNSNSSQKYLLKNIVNFFDDGLKTYISLSSTSQIPVVLTKNKKNKFERINWNLAEDQKTLVIRGVYDEFKLFFGPKEVVMIKKTTPQKTI